MVIVDLGKFSINKPIIKYHNRSEESMLTGPCKTQLILANLFSAFYRYFTKRRFYEHNPTILRAISIGLQDFRMDRKFFSINYDHEL